MKILMVCLGNICRSPTAEAILRHKAEIARIPLIVDSAGTSNEHEGEGADPRSIKHAEKRGYTLSHVARQIQAQDFEDFDLILTMDDSHYRHALSMAPAEHNHKIKKIVSYCKKPVSEIPDPYYGTAKDFEIVIDLLEQCIEGLITALRKEKDTSDYSEE